MIFFSTIYWFRYIGWLKYILVWPSIYQFVQRHIDWLIFLLVCSRTYWYVLLCIGFFEYILVWLSMHRFAQVHMGLLKYILFVKNILVCKKKHIGYISLYTFITDVLNYWSCDKITIPYHMTTVMWSSKKYKPIK